MYVKQTKALRLFHNKIKQTLLNRYATDMSVLVDIGVGRGGDIFKWSRCKVRQVLAYDVDAVSVQEAVKRYELACIDADYQFYTCASMDCFVDTHVSHLFDRVPVISCQFAIHYFFQSEDMVDNLLMHVHRLLAPGGVFVGTFMNGDAICRLTDNLAHSFHNDAMMIQPKTDVVADFGTSIEVYLSDTLYFGEQSVSCEYLVRPTVFVDKAHQHGLSCIEVTPFESFHQSSGMSDSVKTCSFSYSTFVFRKQIS
jgi:mRNA (guanine-N7-)-methyltransferase